MTAGWYSAYWNNRDVPNDKIKYYIKTALGHGDWLNAWLYTCCDENPELDEFVLEKPAAAEP